MNEAKLVAHRGFAAAYPENSILAFRSAIECGCQFLELDVQITRDAKAIVIHDTDLQRTGDKDVSVFDSTWMELKDCSVGEPKRFGKKFENEKLPSLSNFVDLLRDNPDVHAFVEIKEECLQQFGIPLVLKCVCETIKPVEKQCSIISFDADVLFAAKKNSQLPLGYVLHKYDEQHLATLKELAPDIAICNYKKIPDEDGSLFLGNWDWFLYEIVDPAIARKWSNRGVRYIETMEIGPMINALG